MPKLHNGIQLSIVLPCLNEADTIANCVESARLGIERCGVSGEVIVVDNGSSDNSATIAEKAGARIMHVKRKGYGSALRGGIHAAQGHWVIMGDADGSYDFSTIEEFVRKLHEGYDLVVGCRFPAGGGSIIPGAMSWKNRWIGNPALSFIGRLFFRCPVKDFHCGLRAINTASFHKMELKTSGMEFASEMVIKAAFGSMRIAQVPIILYPDGRSRPSHLKPWRDGWRHLRLMLLFSPRWLFIYPGLVSFFVGLSLFVPLACSPITVANIQFDTNTLLVTSMMMVVGFQILFFGVFTNLYCVARGLLAENARLLSLLSWFSLERGIFIGLAIVVGGIGLLLMALLMWRNAGFGHLSHSQSLRLVIPAITFMTIGAQTIFSSLFLSILDLNRD